MKAVVIYYDGNDYRAKLVEFEVTEHPADMTKLGLGLPESWSVNAIVEVPDSQEYLYVSSGQDPGCLVVTLEGDSKSEKVLDLEILADL